MREKEPATSIIFVRHGQTDFPIDRIYCDDKEDPPLNDSGLAQARSAAELLAQAPVAAVYASPLQRTRTTAEEIASRHRLEIAFEPELVERRFGVWDGLYFHEVEQGYPEQFTAWKRDQAGFAPEGGETAYDLLERVRPVVAGIVERHRGETVVVVSHVGPIRVLLADAVGMPVSGFRSLRIDPASLSRVDYGRRQNNLVFVNYVSKERLVSTWNQ